jgi:hypothetical protein
MKIEDTLDLTRRYSATGGFYPDGVECPSIHQADIFSLADKLTGKGIPIITGLSEKEILYISGKQERHAIIPLAGNLIGCNSNITKYFLKGDYQFSISLEDFFESNGDGRDGGTVYNRKGIICSLSMEASAKEAKLIEKAKTIIREFYDSQDALSFFQ